MTKRNFFVPFFILLFGFSFQLKAQARAVALKNANTVNGLMTILNTADTTATVISFNLVVIPNVGDAYQIQAAGKGSSWAALQPKLKQLQAGDKMSFTDILIKSSTDKFARNIGNQILVLQ